MSYAGDLEPAAAFELVSDGGILVDVRTEGEWTHIGVPDLSGVSREPLFIQWNLGDGTPNPSFVEELVAAVPTGTNVIMLCRSGARSVAAAEAATAAGFTAYNVLEGFEGVPDSHGDRVVNGWKNRQLPWK